MKLFFLGFLAFVSLSALAETTESCRKSYVESGFIQHHYEQDLRRVFLKEFTTKLAGMNIEAKDFKLFVDVSPGYDQLPVFVIINAKGEAATQRSSLVLQMHKIQTKIGTINYTTISDSEGFPLRKACSVKSLLRFKIVNKTNGNKTIATFNVKSQIEF